MCTSSARVGRALALLALALRACRGEPTCDAPGAADDALLRSADAIRRGQYSDGLALASGALSAACDGWARASIAHNNAGVAEWMLARDGAAAARAEARFVRAIRATGLLMRDEGAEAAGASASAASSPSPEAEAETNLRALRAAPWVVDALKNLRWAAQARNAGDLASELKASLLAAVTTLVPDDLLAADPASEASVSLFDVSLAALVCARVASSSGRAARGASAGSAAERARRLYLDQVKRSVTFFPHSDVPHRLYPAVGGAGEVVFDINYRMRDFQGEPPADGRAFEGGASVKEVGVLRCRRRRG